MRQLSAPTRHNIRPRGESNKSRIMFAADEKKQVFHFPQVQHELRYICTEHNTILHHCNEMHSSSSEGLKMSRREEEDRLMTRVYAEKELRFSLQGHALQSSLHSIQNISCQSCLYTYLFLFLLFFYFLFYINAHQHIFSGIAFWLCDIMAPYLPLFAEIYIIVQSKLLSEKLLTSSLQTLQMLRCIFHY